VIDLEDVTGERVEQESADDPTVSSELQLRVLELGVGSSGAAVPIGRAAFELATTLRYFPDTANDTIDELGILLTASAKLRVPFTSWAAVSLGADLFAYQAKVRRTYYVDDPDDPIERDLAASVVRGGGLTFDRVWTL
jgi:hypothetical protein